ncbi:MAG TPA: MoaD/ThiS family protein [Gammaproteobacteria bacterium]|nr:MoaD/ThiS family protein [Gammaproteobacteria bacterium]
MKLRVLFFASLRDASGVGEKQMDVEPGQSVADLWRGVSAGFEQLPAKVLCAVNQEYVDSDYLLQEGDIEVAFFPPVTGG